jgi:DNA-binding FadR family transcriptional regulator
VTTTFPTERDATHNGSAAPAGSSPAAAPRLRPQTLARPRMRDGVVNAILAFIVQQELAEGYQLPTEGELVRHFGASRTVVREALGVLEEKRVLRVLHGRGALVTARDEWDILDPQVLAADLRHGLGSRLTDELLRNRLWLEQELAAEAATNASDAELDAIGAHLERMGGVIGDPDAYSDLDLEFHKLIARASHNRVGMSIMFALANPLFQVRRSMHGRPGTSARAQRDHTVILATLRRRDSVAARAELQRHIEWTRELWQTMLRREERGTRG